MGLLALPGGLLCSSWCPTRVLRGLSVFTEPLGPGPRMGGGPHGGPRGRKLWVVSASCALSPRSSCPLSKGVGGSLGAVGKEGGEVPAGRRGPGLPGDSVVPATLPHARPHHPVSASIGFAEVGVRGCRAAGVLAPGERGWPVGCRGEHLWALTAALDWTQQNQNCCVTAVSQPPAVAGVTGEFPTLPPGGAGLGAEGVLAWPCTPGAT